MDETQTWGWWLAGGAGVAALLTVGLWRVTHPGTVPVIGNPGPATPATGQLVIESATVQGGAS